MALSRLYHGGAPPAADRRPNPHHAHPQQMGWAGLRERLPAPRPGPPGGGGGGYPGGGGGGGGSGHYLSAPILSHSHPGSPAALSSVW